MTELPSFQEALRRVDPQTYRQHLGEISLDTIVLEDLQSTVDRAVVGEADQFELRIDRDWAAEFPQEAEAHFLLTYHIRGMWKRRRAVRIRATYRMQIRSTADVPAEFYVVYVHLAADGQAWPYVRELVQSLTGRMGVSPLTLPLLIGPGTFRDRSESE